MISNVIKNPHGDVYAGSFTENGLKSIDVANFATASFDVNVSGQQISGYTSTLIIDIPYKDSVGTHTYYLDVLLPGTLFTMYHRYGNSSYQGSFYLDKGTVLTIVNNSQNYSTNTYAVTKGAVGVTVTLRAGYYDHQYQKTSLTVWVPTFS